MNVKPIVSAAEFKFELLWLSFAGVSHLLTENNAIASIRDPLSSWIPPGLPMNKYPSDSPSSRLCEPQQVKRFSSTDKEGVSRQDTVRRARAKKKKKKVVPCTIVPSGLGKGTTSQ